MGNQLTSPFTISEDSLSTGGPNNLWKIYNATKKSNNTPVSLFILEKANFSKANKHLQEEIFNSVRKEVKTLTKLRHPSILQISEPLGEDSSSMVFATEPLEGSLKYLIETPSKHNLVPSEIELKAQILELIDAVIFLHSNANLLHLSISPENIYLTPSGKFKIAGFFFSMQINNEETKVTPNIDFSLEQFCPHFGFITPEIVKNNIASSASDAFSIGCLIYHLMQIENGQKEIYFLNTGESCSKPKYLDAIQSLTPTLISKKLSFFKSDAVELLGQLLKIKPEDRIQLNEARSSSWFNDPKIKALDYLNHLDLKEEQQKQQFFNGLMNVLNEFDAKVIQRRILPALASQLSLYKMASVVLPLIASILSKEEVCSRKEFYAKVWPHMEELCKGKEISAHSLFLIINNTNTWLRLIEIKDFQSTLLILYQKALGCGVEKIQEGVVKVIPLLAKKIDYATLKNNLLPKVVNLALNTPKIRLKVKCIESISNISSLLDPKLVKGGVMPMLEKLIKSSGNGDLYMEIIRALKELSKSFTYQELANCVVPLLLSMSVKGEFSKIQFAEVIALIKELIDEIDNSRSKVWFLLRD